MDQQRRPAILDMIAQMHQAAADLAEGLGLPPEARYDLLETMYDERFFEEQHHQRPQRGTIVAFRATIRLAAAAGGETARWTLPLTVTMVPSQITSLPRSLSMQLSQGGANAVYLRFQAGDWSDPQARQAVVIALEPPDEPSPLDPALHLEEWIVRGETTVTLRAATRYVEKSVATPGHPLTSDQRVALARYFHSVTLALPTTEAEP